MSWDSSVLHIQSVLRSLVRGDPDAVIQAASGLETGELQRMRHLMDLALQWKEQPDSSGLVDCGLEPLQQDLAQASQVSTGVPDREGAAPPVKEPPPRPSSTSSTLASPSGLPQAPPGAPPAKSPTVQPPPSGYAQGNLVVVAFDLGRFVRTGGFSFAGVAGSLERMASRSVRQGRHLG